MSRTISQAEVAPAQPFFGYELKIDGSAYDLHIEMSFSPDVSLGEVVSQMKNGALLHELNPKADPIQAVGSDPLNYDTTMSFKAMGLRTYYLGHCKESVGTAEWTRHCDMDMSKLDGGKYMNFKSDSTTCTRTSDRLECKLEIQGSMKKLFFMKASALAVRAKYQALINWGRFWYLIENGNISTELSNPLYDNSPLKDDVENLLSEGLVSAKAGENFHLTRKKTFSDRVSR